MISSKMMTKILCGNFEKSFREREKMAALNQERFTLATDDITIEELRNGAKKNQHQQKYDVCGRCGVKD